MIVDHADRLHEGVDDGRAAKFKAALRQLLGHRARGRGFGRHLAHGAVVVDLRLAVDEIPQQFGKAGAFFHDFEPGARREHRALDLGAIAHDAGVAHQPFDFGRPVARDFLRHKAVEGAAEIFALAQDGDPRQAGLKTVEHELFVERAVVVFRHAPFLIVIGDVERIVLGPRATHQGRIVRVRGHSAALVAPAATSDSPGKAKRAQSGLTSRIGTPSAARASPCDSASATRSRRTSATP